mgnify:CR=1 FL=1
MKKLTSTELVAIINYCEIMMKKYSNMGAYYQYTGHDKKMFEYYAKVKHECEIVIELTIKEYFPFT